MGRSFFIPDSGSGGRQTANDYLTRRREAAKQFSKGDHVTVDGIGKCVVTLIDGADVYAKRGMANHKPYDPLKMRKI